MDLMKLRVFLMCAAFGFLAVALYYSTVKPRQVTEASAVLAEIKVLLAQRQGALADLGQPQYLEPDQGVIGSYLVKVRRDGVPKHADMRQKLEQVSAQTTALLALTDVYEPRATTAEFKAEARKFRAYALAWNDRWNSIMEVFMVGGNYPSLEVPFPEGFGPAVAAEQKAN